MEPAAGRGMTPLVRIRPWLAAPIPLMGGASSAQSGDFLPVHHRTYLCLAFGRLALLREQRRGEFRKSVALSSGLGCVRVAGGERTMVRSLTRNVQVTCPLKNITCLHRPKVHLPR